MLLTKRAHGVMRIVPVTGGNFSTALLLTGYEALTKRGRVTMALPFA